MSSTRTNRQHRARYSFVLSALLVALPSFAQPQGTAADPFGALVAPADAVGYFRKAEQATSLLKQEKWAEAEPLLEAVTRDYPLNGGAWAQLGSALHHLGRHAEAIAAYEKAIAILGPGLPYPGPSNSTYWIAASQNALGQTDAALDTLEAMVGNAYVRRPDLMTDRNFANLRSDPRFRALAGKIDASGMTRVEGWRRDIDFLGEELKRNNPAGAPIPADFFTRQRALKAAVPNLDDQQIVAGMGRMMSVLRRGHTALWLGDPDAPSKLDYRPMPIRLYVFPEGVFVTQGLQGHEDLAGAQVIRFGDVDAREMVARVAAMQSSESTMEHAWIAPELLVEPAVLKGLGGAQRPDQAELTLKMPDGRTVTRTLGVIPPPQRSKLNPPPNATTPLFLRATAKAHWLEAMPERNAIYAQVNSISNDDDETMEQFGLRLSQVIADSKPRNLILDIRHNNGGNSFTYPELLRTLIAFSTVEGNHIYVLIGRDVYSAAANFTTDIERFAKPVFVGEPTSATGNQWGDESFFVLPYSGLTGAFSAARWQLSHPWDKRRSIVPQVPVQLTAAAYFKGRDPALDAVFRMIDEGVAKPAVARRGK